MSKTIWRIDDDLTHAPLSRQRKYQIRKLRNGCCVICGKEVVRETQFCATHSLRRGILRAGRNGPRRRKWVDWIPPTT